MRRDITNIYFQHFYPILSNNNIAKRFNNMIKEYVMTDPRYQKRLGVYSI